MQLIVKKFCGKVFLRFCVPVDFTRFFVIKKIHYFVRYFIWETLIKHKKINDHMSYGNLELAFFLFINKEIF